LWQQPKPAPDYSSMQLDIDDTAWLTSILERGREWNSGQEHSFRGALLFEVKCNECYNGSIQMPNDKADSSQNLQLQAFLVIIIHGSNMLDRTNGAVFSLGITTSPAPQWCFLCLDSGEWAELCFSPHRGGVAGKPELTDTVTLYAVCLTVCVRPGGKRPQAGRHK